MLLIDFKSLQYLVNKMMIFNNAKRFRLINKNIIYSISNNISSFVRNYSNSNSNLISTYYRHKSYCITQRCLSSYEPVSRKKGKKNDGSDYVFEEVAKIALVSIKDAIEPLLGKRHHHHHHHYHYKHNCTSS